MHQVSQCQVAAAVLACFLDQSQKSIHGGHGYVAWRQIVASLVPCDTENLIRGDLPDISCGDQLIIVRHDQELRPLELIDETSICNARNA